MHTRCARCGAPAEPRQEICLQCGAQLPRSKPSALERLRRRRILGLQADRVLWLLVLALAALGGAAVAFGARHERQAATPTLIGPGTPPTVSSEPTVAPGSPPGSGFFTTTAGTSTAAATTGAAPQTTRQQPAAPGPTISAKPLPVAPGAPSTATVTTPAPTTSTPRPRAGAVGSWPAGTRGWTVIVQSLPATPAGHDEALATARKAMRAGLPQIGVLLSSRYTTLRAGYWVVYSGVLTSEAAAERAAPAASARGFAGAYPAHIVP